jgi:hypothetical protein
VGYRDNIPLHYLLLNSISAVAGPRHNTGLDETSIEALSGLYVCVPRHLQLNTWEQERGVGGGGG